MPTGYNSASPYASTEITDGYLDILNFVDMPAKIDDVRFTVTGYYAYRPDLLAHDLYGNSNLWWVFAARNKDVIQDSVYDFIPGQIIFLPQLITIKSVLGI